MSARRQPVEQIDVSGHACLHAPRRAPLARTAALAALTLVGCTAPDTTKQPVPLTPPQDKATAPVVREARPTPPGPAGTVGPPLSVTVPSDAIYVCATQSGGAQQQVVIQFEPKVEDLCRKHPEMGPCQYERDICRRSGGRVFAKGGEEITLATEAEYDKKVMRVRFKAN